jgi:hypothetical protein
MQQHLTLDIQKLAFEKFRIVDSIVIFNRAVKIYQLSTITDILKPEIRKLLNNRKDFRRGCEIIMSLGIHDSYSLEEVV